MKIKNLILVTAVICGLVALSACVPATPLETLQETPEVEAPPTALEEIQEGAEPYPYPAPGQAADVQPSDSTAPYPPPQEVIVDRNPYPDVEYPWTQHSVLQIGFKHHLGRYRN